MEDTNELLRRAGDGDQKAVLQLLDRHRDQLKRMVQVRMDRALLPRFDPSDVVQEALIVASKRLPQYLAEKPIDFYPWLRQITYDRLIDLHRHHVQQKRNVRRERAAGMDLPNESADRLVNFLMEGSLGPRSKMIRKELQQRVRESLDALPKIYREVLVLRHLEQLNNTETAGVLGINASTAKTRYYRAIEQLHQTLGGSIDD